VLVTADEIGDPQTMRLITKLNGQVMQDAHTRDMVFTVRQLIAFLSQDTTLLPGTVILTGTASGVGAARKPPVWMKPGDVVEVEFDRIGVLRNTVG
jgi:2-keto-4-pentenoate hydratase/2-oxohepta-3-ene-1,7-dioic acid hydratase in catechol pathway